METGPETFGQARLHRAAGKPVRSLVACASRCSITQPTASSSTQSARPTRPDGGALHFPAVAGAANRPIVAPDEVLSGMAEPARIRHRLDERNADRQRPPLARSLGACDRDCDSAPRPASDHLSVRTFSETGATRQRSKKTQREGWVEPLGAVTHRELALQSEPAKSRASCTAALSDRTDTSNRRVRPRGSAPSRKCQIVHVLMSVLRHLPVSG